MHLGVTMFGSGQKFLPYVIRALAQAAEGGLRPENVRMRLSRVEQERAAGTNEWEDILRSDSTLTMFPGTTPVPPQMPSRARLHLRTPMRLRLMNDLVTPDRFTPGELGIAVRRRLTSLAKYHGGGRIEERSDERFADSKWLDGRIRWKEWTRFSSRQGTKMQMGGLVGEAVLELNGLESIWPWLWAGQFSHAGKATSMGLGRYDIDLL
jgi:hypothetical protein